ncbi:hypothetical protein [Abyssalbus ytuae]|uniref:Lipoprotein n=1 Tax=Abyssalbus ytuae TaxID=2926907 RepID=A0A9E7D4P5_9FLAO|nr:hypothetical protein [Abyssalbus ytuae]UOB19164.1 hypothetical protein MQE35_07660 [Abyssalbus ytuae]
MLHFIKYGCFIIGIFLIGCNHNNNETSPEQDYEKNCNDTFCTLQYVTVTIKAEDSNGDPVVLDKIEVTNLENNEVIFSLPDNNIKLENNVYPVFDDRFVKQAYNKEIKVNFKGYLNTNKVADQNFIVTSDCCHVSMISENRTIVIN